MLLLASLTSLLGLVAGLDLRKRPVQKGHRGEYTCAQFECSQFGCAATGVELKCVNAMKNGYGMLGNSVIIMQTR
ncbi:hypothetical protein BDV36DRAFT_260268 [Aspergillus pseudocaelatus]|uniref:Uncharacterized protein n=1 Tax=Aspergillus pseudocaelatus TaxID=1825620 RepID=A0ABQ6WHE7_9EURO|nr:hypothetical protein BDV36DRAFT_260268 [Aspergillus pseudocaelatus]